MRKDDKDECQLYYQLIYSSKILVNTTSGWVGASSIIECMYHGLPVIINPNNDIIDTFGNDCNFGFYSRNKNELFISIKKLFELPYDKYQRLALEANAKVKDFSWNNYVDKVIALFK